MKAKLSSNLKMSITPRINLTIRIGLNLPSRLGLLNTQTAPLKKGVRFPPQQMIVLDMTLNNLIVKLQ